MNHVDEALWFDCAGDRLIGILSRPEQPCDIGVVILIGGPQYRVGGHRQYVLLARALASAGYPVLRFDYRGNGDSEGEFRNYECVSDDIGAAIAALQRGVRPVRRVVLWGLCGGASAALIYCEDRHDVRVAGLCLMNPWVRSETTQARTQIRHYYRQRLLDPQFWVKLGSGKVASWSALRELARSLRLAWAGNRPSLDPQLSFQQRMAIAWRSYRGRMLLMISGRDYTAKEFLDHVRDDSDWAGALERSELERCDLPDADHTCSERDERLRMQMSIIEWLDSLDPDRATSRANADDPVASGPIAVPRQISPDRMASQGLQGP